MIVNDDGVSKGLISLSISGLQSGEMPRDGNHMQGMPIKFWQVWVNHTT
jgi:hypothetical protein